MTPYNEVDLNKSPIPIVFARWSKTKDGSKNVLNLHTRPPLEFSVLQLFEGELWKLAVAGIDVNALYSTGTNPFYMNLLAHWEYKDKTNKDGNNYKEVVGFENPANSETAEIGSSIAAMMAQLLVEVRGIRSELDTIKAKSQQEHTPQQPSKQQPEQTQPPNSPPISDDLILKATLFVEAFGRQPEDEEELLQWIEITEEAIVLTILGETADPQAAEALLQRVDLFIRKHDRYPSPEEAKALIDKEPEAQQTASKLTQPTDKEIEEQAVYIVYTQLRAEGQKADVNQEALSHFAEEKKEAIKTAIPHVRNFYLAFGRFPESYSEFRKLYPKMVDKLKKLNGALKAVAK